MDMLTGLRSKDNKEAYRLLLLLEEESERCSDLYGCLDDFLSLLRDESSLARTRGFRLACAQARWDREGRLEKNLDALLSMLDDEKATAVRQCLPALRQVILYLPELKATVKKKLEEMDFSKYKESMVPLLQKDVDQLWKWMEGDIEK